MKSKTRKRVVKADRFSMRRSFGPNERAVEKIRSALLVHDKTVSDYESRWGIDRLPDLVGPELRERFELQCDKLNKAIRESNVDEVEKLVPVSCRAYAALEKAAREAGEKELGFLAKNRRALLGAGALGAAGLAGYGAYRAFGGGGQSKAASYRGMRKLAEDRISPARIRAGKADPFSGVDIHHPGMSRSASPYEPIGIKAQRIRDQINKDMRGYVSHVGGGYNLDRYLNKFNK